MTHEIKSVPCLHAYNRVNVLFTVKPLLKRGLINGVITAVTMINKMATRNIKTSR